LSTRFRKEAGNCSRNCLRAQPREFCVTPQSQVWLDRGSLRSETLKSGSLEERESEDSTEEAILRVSAP
jgi:hypothetical protein